MTPPNVVRGLPSASLLLDDLEALLDEPADEKAVYVVGLERHRRRRRAVGSVGPVGAFFLLA